MAAATIIQNSGVIPYTPSGAKSKGDIVVTVSRVGVAVRDIAANVAGELMVEGTALFPKSTSGGTAIPDGTRVFWNAGSGIISITATDGLFLGTTVGASADGDATQQVSLNRPGTAPFIQAAVVAPLTENATTIGGTQDSNFATLAMSVTWNGSSVYPSAADATLIIDALRENAAKINAVIAALKTAGLMATS
jgi:predicted RecA/RadA family phage recombinase